MHKLTKLTVLILLVSLFASSTSAMVELKSDKDAQFKTLGVTSFTDYPPFGEIVTNSRNFSHMQTIYSQFIEDYAQTYYYKISYVDNKPYKDLVTDVIRGEIDLILGIYYDTPIYRGIEYVYPSILNNPMTVVMLPNRINEVHKMEDLKNLKGGMDSREHLAGYVTKEMKNYDIVYEDTSEKLYEKLFTGEIDYVFTSYYYGIVQTSRLGIRKQVSFSKQSLWDMPLFIGVSKTGRYRKSLFATLTKMLQNPKYKQEMEKHLIETIQQIERENIGVVPPAFTKK